MPRLFASVWKVAIIVVVWLAIGWVTGYLHKLDVRFGTDLPPWVRVIGAAAVVAGAGLVLKCGLMLSTRGIGTLRGEEWFMPREFVASGPFRFVRNPMSLGGMVLMTGIALCRRSAVCLVLTAALLLLFHLVVVCMEEPGLEKKFGDSYREYCRNVPRWLPRWRPWPGGSAERAARDKGHEIDGGRSAQSRRDWR